MHSRIFVQDAAIAGHDGCTVAEQLYMGHALILDETREFEGTYIYPHELIFNEGGECYM